MPAESLASWLGERGFLAGALLDTGNLSGALEFYEACRARGVKPLVGADLACPVTGERFGVIALDRQGYADLCAIVSAAGLRPEAALLDAIRQASGAIAVLTPRAETALVIRESLGRRRVWLEAVANDGRPGALRDVLAAARRHDLPAVASWDSLCRDRSEYAVARVLRAIGEGKAVSEIALGPREPYLESARELERICRAEPELLAESVRIAEMADLDLELGTAHFPRLAASPAESQAALQAMCREALARKYPHRRDEARRRLAEELRVVGALGMADYFLVVADLVGFAERSRIPVAGRGSGAGSMIAYLLGITQSDPVAEDLLFERFLNEHRPDYPNLDIDISWKRRDEVIQYAYRRFGVSNAAMISTRSNFELRLAAREVAKALGLSPYEAQSLADRLPYRRSEDPSGAIVKILGSIKPELAPRERRAIGDLAQALIGFPNHSGVHCGGIVVSDRPITHYTPLEMAAKGIQVTQFDMHAIERIGLVKIDLLGNRALSTIEEAHRAIAERTGLPPTVPLEDVPTASILKRGRTLGCFQLESPAVRNLLGMMRASTRADATLALALVRPGPSAGGMKQEFLRRRAASLAGVGAASGACGLPVYEEDVMRIIAAWTGVGLAEADMLRRALKDEGQIGAARDKFIMLTRSAGRSRGEAERAWEDVRRFSRYTFCKAHAASFGGLAYAMAYLKANHPLEFYAALLRNHSGMYPLWVHVNEARRVGVRVLPPSVNRSEADFTIEEGAVRTGFASVAHLAEPSTKAILESRRPGRFLALADFLARVRATREEVLALVASGAFDEIEPDRSGTLAALLATRGRNTTAGALPLGLPQSSSGLPSRAFSGLALRKMEYTALGFSPLVHPLAFFDGDGEDTDPPRAPCGRTRMLPTRSVRGLLAAARHYREKGPGLWFVSLDSPDGIHECTVPDQVPTVRLEIGQAYACRGLLETRFGVPSLRARSVRALREKPTL